LLSELAFLAGAVGLFYLWKIVIRVIDRVYKFPNLHSLTSNPFSVIDFPLHTQPIHLDISFTPVKTLHFPQPAQKYC